MSRAQWITTVEETRYEFEMHVQFESKDKPGILQSMNLFGYTFKELRSQYSIIKHYSTNVMRGKLNISRFTGKREVRVRGTPEKPK